MPVIYSPSTILVDSSALRGLGNGVIGNYPGAASAWMRESTVIDDGGWKQVWAEMTDSKLEDRLFTYLWLSLHTPNAHAGRVAQLIEEAERRGQAARLGWQTVAEMAKACASHATDFQIPLYNLGSIQ